MTEAKTKSRIVAVDIATQKTVKTFKVIVSDGGKAVKLKSGEKTKVFKQCGSKAAVTVGIDWVKKYWKGFDPATHHVTIVAGWE